MGKLLIIEDEIGLQKQYRWSLNDYELLYAGDRESALEALKQAPELVLLDLGLPPDPDNATEDLALLSDITSKLPATKVIVLTGSEQKEQLERLESKRYAVLECIGTRIEERFHGKRSVEGLWG